MENAERDRENDIYKVRLQKKGDIRKTASLVLPKFILHVYKQKIKHL